MANGNKIGEAYVEIRADADKLGPELQGAKATVERETAEMGESVQKNVANKFQDASSKLSGFVGAATGLLGVAALANRVGDAIGKIAVEFLRAKDNALEFRRAAREIDDVQAAIDQLADSTASYTANLKNGFFILTDYVGLTEERSRAAKIAVLEEERTQRQAIAALERRNELERERVARLKEEAAARRQIIAENQALEDAQLTGVEKIAREEERARREVLQRIAETEDQLTKNALQRRLELIEQIADAQRKALAEQEAREKAADEERQRRAEESAQKQADALASALTGALDRISSAQRVNEAKTMASLREIQRMLESTALYQGHNGRAR